MVLNESNLVVIALLVGLGGVWAVVSMTFAPLAVNFGEKPFEALG
jgi:hypothetical protein